MPPTVRPIIPPITREVSEAVREREKSSATHFLLKIWLILGTWCSCVGWFLSVVGQLNATGYAVTAGVSLAIGALWFSRHKLAMPRLQPKLRSRLRPRISLHRYARPLPLIYLLLLAGSFVGGLVYAPNNYDMLTYRVPRILNWLAAGRWHWIHAMIDRMNYSGAGWEWMAVPLLLFTHRTSLFFLINIAAYLLLPGVFFSFLRNLGVTGRMAWAWMWLLPAGSNFVMQAGGGANDTLSVVYLLTAMFFAFRARRSGAAGDVWWSIVAAGLMTACKSSNLPLGLPCLIALLPTIPNLKRHLFATLLVLCVAGLSSLLPTLILNFHYTRDWAGAPGDPAKLKIHNQVSGLLGNSLELAVANLQPPIMPLAGKWNQMSSHLLPAAIADRLARDFPRFSLHMNELPQEEQSGLGLGLTALAIVSLLAILWRSRATKEKARGAAVGLPGSNTDSLPSPAGDSSYSTQGFAKPDPWRGSILLSGLISLGVLMSILGSEAIARLASPYYIILIAIALLHPVNWQLARQKWWITIALLASLSAIPGLFFTPSRPLFPAVRLTRELADRHPGNVAIQRAADVYQVYSQRAENLAPLRQYLPAGQKVIGIVGDDDTSETALWEPFGTRRVVELIVPDGPAFTRSQGIEYVVVGADGLEELNTNLPDFLAKYGGKVIAEQMITLKVSEGPEQWYVVELPVAASGEPTSSRMALPAFTGVAASAATGGG